MLSQFETATLLDQCANEDSPKLAMEEVLSAYVAWKLIRGQNCSVVLQKLRYLSIYLRATNRQSILETARDVLIVIATELSYGGGLVGASPISTPTGKQVWNTLRRKFGSASFAFNTDPEYGGPIAFRVVRSTEQPRDPDPAPARRTTGGSGTVTTADFATRTDPSSCSSRVGLFFRRHRGPPRRPESENQFRWSDRPRWIRAWFLTRPHLAGSSPMLHMLVPEYRSLVPSYTSSRGTIPLYVSRP